MDLTVAAEPRDRQLCDCPACGRFQVVPILPPCATVRCIRCRQVLRRTRDESLIRPLACALAGLALYGAVIGLPFLGLEIFGRVHDTLLISFPAQFVESGFWPLAALVALFVIILPPAKLLLLSGVLLGLRLRLPSSVLRVWFRWYDHIGPWAMVEVFLVGFFVAYSRLIGLATVDVGPATWALGGLMLTIVAADISLDPEAVWRAIEHARPGRAAEPEDVRSGRLVGCQSCGKVCAFTHGDAGRCPRCGARIWPRKPASFSRTLAFLIAASICAVGAYACPIMTVTRLGQGQPSTIIAGMIELAAIGWWPIAIIVFIASITIPLFKLSALAYMLVSTYRGSSRHLAARTRIYRFVEAIGRWSMIDIFMVSILTALVQLGFLGEVQPDFGAVAFAAVVILTMFAATSFDPRLMWDAAARGSPDRVSAFDEADA